jgi:methylated-DNA-protein-cysteine methyltransferase related protein
MSDLSKQVYDYVAKVPKGNVTTYGAIARSIGTSARVVGNILHKNINPATIPCHRVVRSDGSIATGYAFGGPDVQKAQLQSEAVIFTNNRVDLDQSLWQPQ